MSNSLMQPQLREQHSKTGWQNVPFVIPIGNGDNRDASGGSDDEEEEQDNQESNPPDSEGEAEAMQKALLASTQDFRSRQLHSSNPDAGPSGWRESVEAAGKTLRSCLRVSTKNCSRAQIACQR